jgi:hypothetical protein
VATGRWHCLKSIGGRRLGEAGRVPRASRWGEDIDWGSGKERGSPRKELYGSGGLAEVHAAVGQARGRWHRLTSRRGARRCREPRGGGGWTGG